mgnify:CR=1 FL=1
MKVNLVNSIRRILKIDSNNRDYFTRQEIEAIIKQINPELDFNTLEYKIALSSTVPGWTEQKTIETHPNMVNLNTIYDLLKGKSYRLETLISMIDDELLSKSKSIRFENKILTIELR